MDERHEYVVEVRPGDTIDAPRGLWRRGGDGWEYFSVLDREWHEPGRPRHLRWQWPAAAERDVAPPHRVMLRTVSAAHAGALVADPGRFTRYWSLTTSAPDGSPRATTVYRAISSPELLIEEMFCRHETWMPTSAIAIFHNPGLTNDPPDLTPIDADTAEQIIGETHHVGGATGWWPKVDPEAVQFVVEEISDAGGGGVRVTGRLDHGSVSANTKLQNQSGRSVLVLDVEAATPGDGDTLTLVVDRVHADRVGRGLTLVTPPYPPPPHLADPETIRRMRLKDFTPEEWAAAQARVREEELERTRRIFGDQEPFPIPDTPYD